MVQRRVIILIGSKELIPLIGLPDIADVKWCCIYSDKNNQDSTDNVNLEPIIASFHPEFLSRFNEKSEEQVQKWIEFYNKVKVLPPGIINEGFIMIDGNHRLNSLPSS